MSGIRTLLICIVLACQASALHALDPRKQMSQYVHDVWNTTGGLPQDSVNAITQTPDGYLWIATQEGLARFDGVGFSTFDTHTTRGVLENFVHSLFTDRNGTLWAGASGGMVRYDGNGRFTAAWIADDWPTTAARHIAEDAAGTLWLGMGSDGVAGTKGVVRYRGGIQSILTTKDGLSSNVVSCVAFDRQGGVWLATSKGLDVMRNGKVVRTYTIADGLGSDIIRTVLIDRTGTVWAGTENGLSFLKNGRFSTLTTHDGLSADLVLRLFEDRDGGLWAGTIRGLNRILGGRVETAPPATPLGTNTIYALFEDREGSLWIGTRANGLHRLRSAKFTAAGLSEGLSGENVNGIYEDRRGRIWIGTTPGGVTLYENGRFRRLEKASTPAEGSRAFREDSDGTMWIGTREGVSHLGPDGRLTTYTQRDGLPDGNVLAVLRDRRGVLWLGTALGLARYENGRIVKVPTPRGFPPTVRLIHEDRSGRVWFGGGEGLVWWDGAAFHVDPQFAKAHIQSVSEDTDGTLWFGTWSQGLHRLRAGRMTRFTTAQGLYDDVAWSVLDDGRGHLWMGSNRGIYRVAKRQLEDLAAGRIRTIESTVFGTADGMRRHETNWGNPPAIRARDGRLWFGTTGGIVVVDPADLRTNRIPPPVVLERFVADEREVSMTAPPKLKPGTHNIEFHYAGLSLVSPGRVRYRYRLEGYDRHWIDAGSRRTAYYTNIDPGPYRFRVIAANDDGIWNEAGASIAFRMEPFFTQTGWFYGLVVVALILFGVALNALRERHRRMRHQAFHDPLTGLPNRMRLDELAMKEKTSYAVLFLDLDGFKGVNDSLGHASGDQLLQRVALRFRSCLGPRDTLARIGGDEFAVLVRSLDARAIAADMARRLIAAVAEPFLIDGTPVAIGVSIGIAIHPADGADVRTILQSADRAMYRAKVAGGRAFRLHGEELQIEMKR